MGRHSLWHMDVVSVAIIGVHSVGVRRRALVCSSAGGDRYRFTSGFYVFGET